MAKATITFEDDPEISGGVRVNIELTPEPTTPEEATPAQIIAADLYEACDDSCEDEPEPDPADYN